MFAEAQFTALRAVEAAEPHQEPDRETKGNTQHETVLFSHKERRISVRKEKKKAKQQQNKKNVQQYLLIGLGALPEDPCGVAHSLL